MAVNIELNDGRLLQIRPAWKCNSRKDEHGNTETSCKVVENHIWVSEPDDEEYFAESERLYRFVSKGYIDWMPNVKPYEAPDQLKKVPHSWYAATVTINYPTTYQKNAGVWGNRILHHLMSKKSRSRLHR